MIASITLSWMHPESAKLDPFEIAGVAVISDSFNRPGYRMREEDRGTHVKVQVAFTDDSGGPRISIQARGVKPAAS